jgi:hypothetical protein
MKRLKRVVLHYEDSTVREIPFNSCSAQAQTELARLGLSDSLAAADDESYVLLQWADGWKEVVAADERATALLRYYTVERVEEVGRLSLEVKDMNPELLVIKRLPGAIESVVFVNQQAIEAYKMEKQATVKEGGKAEHVYYDQKKHASSAVNAASGFLIIDALNAELQKRGLSATAALAKGEHERLTLYAELGTALGLRATQRQQDIYGFFEAVLQRLEATN